MPFNYRWARTEMKAKELAEKVSGCQDWHRIENTAKCGDVTCRMHEYQLDGDKYYVQYCDIPPMSASTAQRLDSAPTEIFPIWQSKGLKMDLRKFISELEDHLENGESEIYIEIDGTLCDFSLEHRDEAFDGFYTAYPACCALMPNEHKNNS